MFTGNNVSVNINYAIVNNISVLLCTLTNQTIILSQMPITKIIGVPNRHRQFTLGLN